MITIRANCCFSLKKSNFRVMVLPFPFGTIFLVCPVTHHIIVASQTDEFRRICIRGAEIYGGQVASLLRRAWRYQGRGNWREASAAFHQGLKVEWYTASRSGDRHPGHIHRWLHEGRCFHRLESKRVWSLLRLHKHRQGIQSVVVVQADGQWIGSVRSRCCGHYRIALRRVGGELILHRKVGFYHGFHIQRGRRTQRTTTERSVSFQYKFKLIFQLLQMLDFVLQALLFLFQALGFLQ